MELSKQKAFVLMTAMPPTTGHWQLIQFARQIVDHVEVILCTQPHEPMVFHRAAALRKAISELDGVFFTHHCQEIEQDPSAPGFWKTWQDLMWDFGLLDGDIIVSSEPYGQQLAMLTGATFFPYDLERSLNTIKASNVRDNPMFYWDGILPEFQKYLTTTITIFGAESTGKSTLSEEVSRRSPSNTLWEFARPYLEQTGEELTTQKIKDIWQGQLALQRQGRSNLLDKPVIIQDTDLFSTIGYWKLYEEKFGECPNQLIQDAKRYSSDLYVVTPSNIPFEKDPLRYGGDKRETTDQYWIDLLEEYNLPYIYLKASGRTSRRLEACAPIDQIIKDKMNQIKYDRKGL